MRTSLILLTLTTIELCSCGQSGKSTTDKVKVDLETVDSITKEDKRQSPLTNYRGADIDTESKFTDSNGIAVIQNSLPKGRGYIDSTGRSFAYREFWTRVINETDTPFELTINFPADSVSITSTVSYLKVFLALDTLTIETLTDYVATRPEFFLDTGLNKHTMLQRIINPNEACLFYTGVLFTHGYGSTRAELLLKGHELFYRVRGISMELDSTLIPCGQVVFKN